MTAQLDLFGHSPAVRETYGIHSAALLEKAKGPGGCTCPLCGQNVKIYRRTITAAMVVALIKMYQAYCRYKWSTEDRDRSLHVEGLLKRCDCSSGTRGDFPKLRYWGLIEKVEEDRPDGSHRNGHYRLTPKGRQFILEQTMVQKYAVIYNDTLYGIEGDYVGVRDALKEKFNFDELMKEEVL